MTACHTFTLVYEIQHFDVKLAGTGVPGACITREHLWHACLDSVSEDCPMWAVVVPHSILSRALETV